ncbi:MAG: hypothetical protein H7122_00850 [Chitinophagaceae bacterium]|nr:hypothetical protein [Chitinophagaceae bacterium]
MRDTIAISFLRNEAVSLLSRLQQVKPFTLSMPMVWAAGISDAAMRGITNHMSNGIKELKERIYSFISSLNEEGEIPAAKTQAKFCLLKLRFNNILDQFDIFADVLSQRSEQNTGVWIAGLDVLANDVLQLTKKLYEMPPVMCFLERGHGAAIRKARTRLPGGDFNPVSIIQVPRERMVGSGIAASVIHEAGHQGAALLNLVASLRNAIVKKERSDPLNNTAWSLYNLWISEIIADVWAMGHLGIGATLGLMGVVSLPEYFMFRIKTDDPHPFPWIRVRLSIAFGKYFYPHPQWDQLFQLWHRLYPTEQLSEEQKKILRVLEQTIPAFIRLLAHHRNKELNDLELKEIFPLRQRQPPQLQHFFSHWKNNNDEMRLSSPSLVFAVIAQAKADKKISEETECRLLEKMLAQWAFMVSENRTFKESAKIATELHPFINI